MVVFFFVAGAVCVLDQLLKYQAERKLEQGEEKIVMNGKIIFRRVYNKGAAFNAFEKKPTLVKRTAEVIGMILAVFDGYFFGKKGFFLEKTGLSFLTGGCLSNVIDRERKGKVTDYFGIQTPWKSVTDITFNLGDLFIFAGSILAVIGTYIHGKK